MRLEVDDSNLMTHAGANVRACASVSVSVTLEITFELIKTLFMQIRTDIISYRQLISAVLKSLPNGQFF